MTKEKKEIQVSPKHELNPSLVRCFICGKDTNEIVLLGKLKNDEEAPKYITTGSLCDDCQKNIENGGGFLIEADKNKNRTGRIIILNKKFEKMEHPIAYVLPEDFEKFVKDIEKQKK